MESGPFKTKERGRVSGGDKRGTFLLHDFQNYPEEGSFACMDLHQTISSLLLCCACAQFLFSTARVFKPSWVGTTFLSENRGQGTAENRKNIENRGTDKIRFICRYRDAMLKRCGYFRTYWRRRVCCPSPRHGPQGGFDINPAT